MLIILTCAPVPLPGPGSRQPIDIWLLFLSVVLVIHPGHCGCWVGKGSVLAYVQLFALLWKILTVSPLALESLCLSFLSTQVGPSHPASSDTFHVFIYVSVEPLVLLLKFVCIFIIIGV